MIIRTLETDFSVADQITAADIETIIESGFKAVICNRPDDEGEAHLEQSNVAATLGEAGVEFRYLPVNGANITDQDVNAQAELVAQLPKPLLAYCRTGTRCTKLWALDPARNDSPQQRIDRAAAAGINIQDLATRL